MGGKGSRHHRPMGASEEQIILVSPAVESLLIEVPSNVTVKIRAQDKERTMDFFFLNHDEYVRFAHSQNSTLSRRYVPSNSLSVHEWKTKQDTAQFCGYVSAGQYWIVWKSSSVVRDKNVRMLLTVTARAQEAEEHQAEKILKPLRRVAKAIAEEEEEERVTELAYHVTTPDFFRLDIDRDATVQLLITCVDPNRTMDVQFLCNDEWDIYNQHLNATSSKRYTVTNGLSCVKWKTCADYQRQLPVRKGTYFVVIRSSSVVRDKCVSCNLVVRFADDAQLLMTSIAAGRHRTNSFEFLERKKINGAVKEEMDAEEEIP